MQLHRPSLQTLAADPTFGSPGIAKKHPTYQDVPGMTLVLIVKDLFFEGPTQNKGLIGSRYININIHIYVHVYDAYVDPI